MSEDILLCQPGYEALLARELGATPVRSGPGWLAAVDAPETCFAHLVLRAAATVEGKSVNALAGALGDFFLQSAKTERFEGPWPFVFEHASVQALGRRAKAVEEELAGKLKARMARVWKLATTERPGPGPARGLFVFMPDFDRAFVSRDALCGGQRRMADDPQAPSRSYLKAEEAYAVLGREPAAGETVVDLGAAPGGWSYSAAKRGAKVIAVDNGPLKAGAIHALVEHREEDAFKFAPSAPADSLFCDMVEDPERVTALVERWLKDGLCRRFVVNLKFGRADPLKTLDRAAKALKPRCSLYRARHLYHDREEFTLVGERLD